MKTNQHHVYQSWTMSAVLSGLDLLCKELALCSSGTDTVFFFFGLKQVFITYNIFRTVNNVIWMLRYMFLSFLETLSADLPPVTAHTPTSIKKSKNNITKLKESKTNSTPSIFQVVFQSFPNLNFFSYGNLIHNDVFKAKRAGLGAKATFLSV
ncbi:hypothetical protein HYC85_019059 [Camellia sinensis]|uniref:Uncharacterized protein n=1 Tax=Camellia sinensis TaxID=4442 RepID=A0A7J7GLP5_CAMSI|nr:hypothetical protein HYC85_019059 [Camellia sinensis]